jgi:hypothetical protein
MLNVDQTHLCYHLEREFYVLLSRGLVCELLLNHPRWLEKFGPTFLSGCRYSLPFL